MPSPGSAAPSQPSAALEPVDDTCDRHDMAGPSGSISSTWSARDLDLPLELFRLCVRAPSCVDQVERVATAMHQINLRASHLNHRNHRGAAVGGGSCC